jgi:DNA-directed RNA polymerase specialized sigma24 family protein
MATDEGGHQNAGGFPATMWSVLLTARDPAAPEARAAREAICAAYWRPVCAYLGALGLSKEDAEDATQTLLAEFTNGDSISRVDPAHGRLRHYLKAAARHALYNQRRAARAQRRGGGQAGLSFEELSDSQMPVVGAAPDAAFDHTWAWTVFDRAFQAITESYALRGKGPLLEALKPALLPSGALQSYAEIGSLFSVGEAQIQLEVHRLRRRLADRLRIEVAATLRPTAGPDEVEDELQQLVRSLCHERHE